MGNWQIHKWVSVVHQSIPSYRNNQIRILASKNTYCIAGDFYLRQLNQQENQIVNISPKLQVIRKYWEIGKSANELVLYTTASHLTEITK